MPQAPAKMAHTVAERRRVLEASQRGTTTSLSLSTTPSLLPPCGVVNMQHEAKRERSKASTLQSSKGANLQVQCAVSTGIEVVHHALQRGSIKMEVNTEFVEEIYRRTKAHPVHDQEFRGEKVVTVLDNARAHNQTGARVQEYNDLVLLRLGPYSSMCNPIEGYFSVLKARIEVFLALRREGTLGVGAFSSLTARRMDLLERAVAYTIPFIDSVHLVSRMALYCQHSVAAAIRNEDMQYGA